MIQPLWELEKKIEKKKEFFFPGSVQIWRRGTGTDIWGSLPGAGIEAMELKSQCPSVPLTLQLPPEPLSGDQEKTICALQKGTTVSGQEKPLEVQQFCPEGIPCGNWHSPGWRSRAAPWTHCSWPATCQSQTLQSVFPVCSPQVGNQLFLAHRLDVEIVFPT